MGAPYHLVLIGSMGISMLAGFVLFIIGIIIQMGIGSIVEDYVADADMVVKPFKYALLNSERKSIIPYTTDSGDVDWELSTMGSLTILVGATIIAFSAYGIFAGLKKAPVLLFGLIAIIAITVLIEILLLYFVSSTETSLHTNAKDALSTRVSEKFAIITDSTFNKILNAAMLVGHCCGITGPSDFAHNITYQPPEKSMVISFFVAPACCRIPSLMQGTQINERIHESIITCASSQDSQSDWIYTRGCYDKVFEFVADKHGATILGLSVLLFVWHAIQIILAIMVTLMVPEEEVPVKEPVKEVREEVEVKKKFVPFSKISSYVSSDINRIKSTEIW